MNRAVLFYLWISLMVVFTGKASVVEVGGILTGNTTWTSDNVYVVTDNVVVFHGITLSIEAGTTVKFNQGRGLNIEGGKLHVNGTVTDSVLMLPNHNGDETWNWSGIVVSSVINPGDLLIEYLFMQRAVYGIRVISSRNIVIRNSHIHANFFIGVSLINSSDCLVENNRITDNFLGLEIFASDPGNQSANNVVRGNVFSNQTTNINIQNNNHGSCPNNTVEENIIRDGLHGIWLFNSSQGGSGHAHIRRNIIMNNGSTNDGFGIYAAMDSTVISNNIFWRNTTAAAITGSVANVFTNNSIFENRRGLNIRNNTQTTTIADNTFTGNRTWAVNFLEGIDVNIHQNNIFRNLRDSAVVRNLSPHNINISENYWGTDNDSIIMRLLYDGTDDAQYGLFSYQPILFQPNIQAPISPPFHPVAQYIGGFTRLSWHPNPESDLAGYKIYFGDFEDYSFSHATDILTGTEYILQGHSTLQFAVTAIDTVSTADQPQLSGNESPFAFVTFIPWAGNDTILCASQPILSLENSTLPPNTDSLLWVTNGDGNFSAPQQLQTSYTAGTADLEKREVVLTLMAFRGDLVAVDSLILGLAPVPVADAGPNTIIGIGDNFTTKDAFAMYYDQLLWYSNGDGVFVMPSQLNTLYIPGPEDIENGGVTLFLEASSQYCQSVTDSIVISIRETYSVKGRVWAGNEMLPHNPVVAVLLKNDEASGYSDLVFTDDMGNFVFPALFEGNYLLYAPADTLEPNLYVATYHPAAVNWKEAYVHHLNGHIRELDIRLASIDHLLPKGNGIINGHFALPVQSGSDLAPWCSHWFGDNGLQTCTQGLSNVTMKLYSLSLRKIYGYTLTDHAGNFSFNELPYGNYFVQAEVPGFDAEISEMLYIHPGQQQVSGITLFISEPLKINIEVPPQAIAAQQQDWNLFPNPAKDHIFLHHPSIHTNESLEITIMDSSGMVHSTSRITPADHITRIDLVGYPTGLLLLKVRQGENVRVFKILRR